MSKDNGGPAFPMPFKHAELDHSCEGMTLRDHFAANASDGDICEVRAQYFDYDAGKYTINRQQARYIHADTMLSERAK